MMQFLRHILTGADDVTYDMVHVLAVLAVIEGLSLALYSVVWKGQVFDLQAFGIGSGALFIGIGGALKLKETSEP